MNNLKTFIFKYFIILLGLGIFVLYIWNRFIRERTSKDLPLNLNIIYLFILIYICVLFSYIIYSLIFPKKTNIIIENIIELLFTPLKELDVFIKNMPRIKPYYYIIIKFIFEKIEDMIVNSNKFFYIFWLFPRLVLLIALYVDVFVFHRFHYKYMVILFGLLLFFNKYLIYSLKYYKKEIINNFNNEIETILTNYVPGIHPSESENSNDEDHESGPTMVLSFEDFLEFQTKSIVYSNEEPNIITIFSTSLLKNQFWTHYYGHPDPTSKEYAEIYGTNLIDNYNDSRNFILTKIQEYLHGVLESSKRIFLVIEHHKKTNNNNLKIKVIKIFIYTIYLICWSYVLYISMKTYIISSEDIKIIGEIMINLQDSSNAFSGVIEVKDDNLIFFHEPNYLFYYYIYYHLKIIYFSKLFFMFFIMYKNRFFLKNKNEVD